MKTNIHSSFDNWILFEELWYYGNQRIVLRKEDLAIKLRKNIQDNFNITHLTAMFFGGLGTIDGLS